MKVQLECGELLKWLLTCSLTSFLENNGPAGAAQLGLWVKVLEMPKQASSAGKWVLGRRISPKIIMPRTLKACFFRRPLWSSVRFVSGPHKPLSTGAMSLSLASTNRTFSTNLPSDHYQLLPDCEKVGTSEDELVDQQIAEAKRWWGSPRYDGIKRPYSAEDVVSKRGTLQQIYPSSLMARKLFNLLRERAEAREPVHTMGAIDPVQMTQQAPNQEVLYISGWACSSVLTTTNEVSPDFGDYPYNTVPNQVQRLFKAQQLHDRKHWDARRKLSKDERVRTPYVDHMRPIIADGDTG